MSEISLTDDQLALVLAILHKHLPVDAKVWLFGSRATGKAKTYSDIDLAIDAGAPLPLKLLAVMADQFENSALPYKVDMVDWYAIDDSFRGLVQLTAVKIK